jgi:phosphoenolpyruvate carboxykinase (ATP)
VERHRTTNLGLDEPTAHELGLKSNDFILISFSRKLILIGGTGYAGEIKKSIFTVLNYLMPDQGVLPMHASVNVGQQGAVTVFFGLSGTGENDRVDGPGTPLPGR